MRSNVRSLTRATLAALLACLLIPALPPRREALASPPSCRYTFGQNTIVDAETGLTWEGFPSATNLAFTAAAAHCASLGGGYRVPTIRELASLVEPGASVPLDPNVFGSGLGFNTVSATSYAADPSLGWFVDFGTGEIYPLSTATTGVVRCVK